MHAPWAIDALPVIQPRPTAAGRSGRSRKQSNATRLHGTRMRVTGQFGLVRCGTLLTRRTKSHRTEGVTVFEVKSF